MNQYIARFINDYTNVYVIIKKKMSPTDKLFEQKGFEFLMSFQQKAD